MLINYIIIAWRSILKNSIYSIINITGLAFGLAIAIVVWLWCFDEVNYNKSFKHHDRIVQLYHHITFGAEVITLNDVPAPIAKILQSEHTEFDQVSITSAQSEILFSYHDNAFSKTALHVEPQFLEMFSVDVLQGHTQLQSNTHEVAIAQSVADAVFAGEAIGKTFKLNNQREVTVGAVYRDFPKNSFLADVKLLLPMSQMFTSASDGKKLEDSWEAFSFHCYAIINDNVDINEINGKIKHVLFDHISSDGKSLKPEGFLFPMEAWHLSADFKNGVNTGGQKKVVFIFAAIGVAILLLACVNFVNLSTARSQIRSKEVGVRKVMGSLRFQLILQFLSESFLVVVFSYAIALMLVVLMLPLVNAIAEKELSMQWGNPSFFVTSLIFIVVTSFLAGVYPAIYLSSFSAVRVLKGNGKGPDATWLRKTMIVLQFATAITLMIGTAIFFEQIQHVKNRPVGFDRD
ncbi:ABC transporter permease [Pseudochryseolinea flava]|uniref:ABC transporter permease n=1 Tax=Pseudochryseolinea flava TaxID=2059302 RepID=A0A364XYR8_9BACT|nr:ABC transporter permease [Pseudochryseolinea flava]RAV99502.1 hypothetical protein DQQ10_18015 [Pseudochryseolinea flava]